MRRFYLHRDQDASGVSGLGNVAEGCQFDTGWCALTWLTGRSAMSWYPDVDTVRSIHGHGGMTQVVWIDDESSNVVVKKDDSRPKLSAVFCGHANECPSVCPCVDECYCKEHSCRIG